MKCPICGKTTLPGAKLCGPCRAALKRARDDSVWEVPGTPTTPAGEASSTPGPSPARIVLGSGQLASWRGITIGAVLIALVVAGGTIITRSGEAARAPDIATPFQPVTIVQPAASAAPPAVAPPSERPLAQLVSRPEDALVQPPRHEPPRAPKPARPAPEAAPVVSPPPADPPAPKVEPPKPAPAPVRDPPRAVDPWQRMNDALDRCRGEDLLGRIRCEYRVRASYCEGHWGEVPQCPGAPVNDHGQ